jgi:signal transduction histidine kinase
MLALVINDRGRGLEAENIRKLGAYMQFDRKSREQQGLGLGLVIAKRLTELHGGNLSIQSDLATGTTVVVNLPLAPAGEAAAA